MVKRYGEDFEAQRARIVRPDGANFGTRVKLGIPSVPGARQHQLLASIPALPDGEPWTIEGKCFGGSFGDSGCPIFVTAILETMLAGIAYREEFPWPCCGFRRRVTAQQLSLSARFDLNGEGAFFDIGASIQHGWTAPQSMIASIVPDNAVDPQFFRVPTGTTRFQVGSLLGSGLVGMTPDTVPGGTPAAPATLYPVTQFYDPTPWNPFCSVIWYRQPVTGDASWFLFEF